MRNLILLIALAIFLSAVDATFVFDRRLLNTTKRVGRDFQGSQRYGSFVYNAACPDGSSVTALSAISIYSAVLTGGCLTQESISGAAVPTIGFICQPSGASAGIIHFGYPGSNGFIIGGANFVSTGATSSGFSWGVVGTPSYTTGTASCVASCSIDYCTSSCSASCEASSTGAASGTCTDTTTSGTTYFLPSSLASTSGKHCGSPDACCASGTFQFPTA